MENASTTQSSLLSSQLFNNLKIKVYKTIVVLYGCKTLPLTLREERSSLRTGC